MTQMPSRNGFFPLAVTTMLSLFVILQPCAATRVLHAPASPTRLSAAPGAESYLCEYPKTVSYGSERVSTPTVCVPFV